MDLVKELKLSVDQQTIIATAPLQLKLMACQLEPLYKWASGMMSPIYCDWRKVFAHPDRRVLIKNVFVNGIRNSLSDIDGVVGVSSSGIPWGAYVADILHLPFVWMKENRKNHGLQTKMQGELPKDVKKIVVIEDLISTGGSLADTCVGVRELYPDAEVVGVALFSYQFSDAVELFNEKNLTVLVASGMNRLMADAKQMEYFYEEEFEFINDWLKDPWKYTTGGKPKEQF